MAFEKPEYSRNQVKKAGEILKNQDAFTLREILYAHEVLVNWRASHLYPINTFQSLLRKNIAQIDSDALVAQRLKRTPSIVAKLTRFDGMQLVKMQDIGGLRAVVANMKKLEQLRGCYEGNARLKHELVSMHDYVTTPKSDGYRSIHFVYKYSNPRAPIYDGLRVELQIRTKIQHAWATAVETLGAYLRQPLKSGQGETGYLKFFELASAALCVIEKTPLPAQFSSYTPPMLFKELEALDADLNVLEKLKGFSLATKKITERKQAGKFNLIVLDYEAKTLKIGAYSERHVDLANQAYAKEEGKILKSANLEVVLVAAGSISSLKKAYPNYFLDTTAFVEIIKKFMAAGRRFEKVQLATQVD